MKLKIENGELKMEVDSRLRGNDGEWYRFPVKRGITDGRRYEIEN